MIQSRKVQTLCLLLPFVTLLRAGPASAVETATESSSLDSLLGSWVGFGEIRFESGAAERIKCNVYYTGGGSELRQAIRCATASYKVEIRSKLTHQSEKISGTWEERTYNATGNATGIAGEGRLSLAITGGGFTGSMTVTYATTTQSVVIETEGIPLKSIRVTLSRY